MAAVGASGPSMLPGSHLVQTRNNWMTNVQPFPCVFPCWRPSPLVRSSSRLCWQRSGKSGAESLDTELQKKADRRGHHPCSIEGCSERRVSSDWCAKHYQRWLRLGDPLGPVRAYRGSSAPALPRSSRLCSVEGCDRRHVGRGCAASITTAGDDDRTGHRFQLGHFEPAQPLLQVLAERNRTGIGRLPPGDLRQPQKARALTGQGSTATAGAMTASTAAENAPLCGAATRRALDTALAPPFAGHPAFHRQSAGLSFRMS
jgi:hypothetical protein